MTLAVAVQVTDWPSAREEATRIRYAVFVLEQNVDQRTNVFKNACAVGQVV